MDELRQQYEDSASLLVQQNEERNAQHHQEIEHLNSEIQQYNLDQSEWNTIKTLAEEDANAKDERIRLLEEESLTMQEGFLRSTQAFGQKIAQLEREN